MKHDNHDHAPIVEAWLKEPTLLPPSDTARLTQLVHQTPQQRRPWQRLFSPERTHTMFNVFKLAAASVVLAVTGGFLFSTFVAPQDTVEPLPAGETPSLVATTPAPTTEETVTAEPVEAVETEAVVAPVDVTEDDALFTFGPGSGATAGGYTQVGSISTDDRRDLTEMFDLQSIGGLLVARSELTSPGEGLESVILYSDDAMNWAAAAVPGEAPEILDLAATDEGLLASGSAVVDGERAARLWSSPDGIEWASESAPPTKRIQQIVLADGVDTLVRSGLQAWIDDGENGEWRVWNELADPLILAGPRGIVVWQGGGQDLVKPNFMIHWATPRSAASEVLLPKALDPGVVDLNGDRPAGMGLQVFALEDGWVMVGSEHRAPDEIYVSSNGLEWEGVPRPRKMSEGLVRWIAEVDGQTQGLGTIVRNNSSPTGVWSWELGTAAGAADMLGPDGDEWFDEPVSWNGGQVAVGWDRGRDQFLTLWMATDAEDTDPDDVVDATDESIDDTTNVDEAVDVSADAVETPKATKPKAPKATGETDARFTVRDPNPKRGLVTWKDRATDEDGYRLYAKRVYCGLVEGVDPNQLHDTEDFTRLRSDFVRVGKTDADASRFRPVHQKVRDRLPEISGQQYGSGEIYELYSAAFNEAGESKRVLVGTYITTPEFMCP